VKVGVRVWIRAGDQPVEVLGNPATLLPLLAGPGGAIAALLLFVGYLLRELAQARADRNAYMAKYEQMREARDEFRLIAGEAVRSGKRAVQTSVARDREMERRQESRD